MYFILYPEVHKHAHSLLVYFLHHLSTRTALISVVACDAHVISSLLSRNDNKTSRKRSIISEVRSGEGLAPFPGKIN